MGKDEKRPRQTIKLNQGFGDAMKSPSTPEPETTCAPYNFVPLSSKIVMPQWVSQVSHDIPFEDGLSGVIECRLETMSRIYVRNGGAWPENNEERNNDPNYQSFFKVGDEYIIPGSSLKGMARNIIEIITFGKLSKVNNYKYALRDLTNNEYKQAMTWKSGRVIYHNVKCGWLSRDNNGGWSLTPCDMARVDHSELKKNYGNIDFHNKKSYDKYDGWKRGLDVKFDYQENNYLHQQGKIELRYKKATIDPKGKYSGKLVFTGQINPKKHMEFIFFNAAPKSIAVPDQVKKDFEHVHSDVNAIKHGETMTRNDEWDFWYKKLKHGEKVPVFYLPDGDGIHSMGLAFMYRLPLKYSIHEAIGHTSQDHLSDKKDFAETMFGFIEDKDKLKGRVFFSQAVAEQGTVEPSKLIDTVLGAPKPSYYPNYIVQDGNHPKTFMDKDCEIRGWKRYPARKSEGAPIKPPTEKVGTKFTPLEKGAKFDFKVRFHNLKRGELGALLWALTWGGNTKCVHSLGMGKSLGFGQVKISAKLIKCYDPCRKPVEIDDSAIVDEFKKYMSVKITGWVKSEQMIQLLAMADPSVKPYGQVPEIFGDNRDKLSHMEINGKAIIKGKPAKEFIESKNQNLRLQPHVKPKNS